MMLMSHCSRTFYITETIYCTSFYLNDGTVRIINKVLIKVTLNKVIAGALYIVICG